MVGIRIETLSAEAFRPYGALLEPDERNLLDSCPDGTTFHLLAQAQATGWRVTALNLHTRTLASLEVHRTSMETFEPVTGVAVLCVNAQPSLDGLRAFVLDRPILLYTDVWHNVLTLSEESLIKITENGQVDWEEGPLGVTLALGLAPADDSPESNWR